MAFRIRAGTVVSLLLAVLFSGCRTVGGHPPIYRIRVEKGDTLASIAMKYDTTPARINRLNKSVLAAGLAPGQVLRVEPGPSGIVAGAPKLPGRGAGKRNDKARDNLAPDGDAASPDEFTAADFPDDGGGGGRRGLFFGATRDGADAGSLLWPVAGEISSRFGRRGRDFHRGVDLRAAYGTPVQAAGEGKVAFAGRQHGYGRVVIVEHPGKRQSVYAHLSSVDVEAGTRVRRGAVVGKVGTSGNATGPHLHFEIRDGRGQALDPLSVLPAAPRIAVVP